VPPGRVIKLDEGSPDGSLFPPEPLARAFRTAALYAARRQQLGYRDPCGSDKLRASLATMLREERGLVVDAENICVTRGSQMGIALAARLLARPGAVALAEALTYEPAVAAFQAAGVPVLPVPLDDEGIDVDAVERACRSRKVCAVFLTPHHQFPPPSRSRRSGGCAWSNWPASSALPSSRTITTTNSASARSHSCPWPPMPPTW
jgi:GntR family transcriptional regulator/MocR family aminotransferase